MIFLARRHKDTKMARLRRSRFILPALANAAALVGFEAPAAQRQRLRGFVALCETPFFFLPEGAIA